MARKPNIRLYTSSFCALCDRARRLLEEHGLDYEEVDLGGPEACCHLRERTGAASLPQVSIDGVPLGGYEALAALLRDTGPGGRSGRPGLPER